MQLKEVPILILLEVNFKNPILPIALFPTPSLVSTNYLHPHSVFHLGMLL